MGEGWSVRWFVLFGVRLVGVFFRYYEALLFPGARMVGCFWGLRVCECSG